MKSHLILGIAAIFALSNLSCTQTGNPPDDMQPALVDLHYHWEQGVLDELIQANTEKGIQLAIVGEGGETWGLRDDSTLLDFLSHLEGKPVYKGLQVYSRGWQRSYSKETLSQLDFVAADAMLMPDGEAEFIALWAPDVTFEDVDTFMEQYMAYHLQVLDEPINIWSNPTYLPESLMSRYDELWTADRMETLIQKIVENDIVIEINSKYNIPSETFIRRAKEAGARFSFGTNRHDTEPGDLSYSVQMYERCGLTLEDLYTPSGVKLDQM